MEEIQATLPAFFCQLLFGAIQLYHQYKPGTKPVRNIEQQELDELKRLMVLLIENTEMDFTWGRFVKFNERMTATGFLLSSLSDALEFNNYH